MSLTFSNAPASMATAHLWSSESEGAIHLCSSLNDDLDYFEIISPAAPTYYLDFYIQTLDPDIDIIGFLFWS